MRTRRWSFSELGIAFLVSRASLRRQVFTKDSLSIL
jgi:hypothetical protein